MDIALNEGEPIEMRKKALFWVGQSGNTSAASITALVGLYDRMQNTEMKETLIFVYSQRSEPEALDKLIDIVRHEQNKELARRRCSGSASRTTRAPRDCSRSSSTNDPEL